MKIRLLSMAFACLLTVPVFADTGGNSGGDGGAITDNDPAGVTSIVSISDNEIIQDLTFSVEGLNHSFIGDLIITVSHSTSGKSATLMNRVGTGVGAPDGDSSDLNGTYSFADGAGSIWSEAANGDTNYELTPGTYAASGAGESAVDLASIFAGETTQGDWTFTISDNNGGETGSFTQTSIAFTLIWCTLSRIEHEQKMR